RTSPCTAARGASLTRSPSAAPTGGRSSAPAGSRATRSAASTTAGSTTRPGSVLRCRPRTLPFRLKSGRGVTRGGRSRRRAERLLAEDYQVADGEDARPTVECLLLGAVVLKQTADGGVAALDRGQAAACQPFGDSLCVEVQRALSYGPKRIRWES